MKPTSFNDTKNRCWTLELNAFSAQKLKEELEFDLSKITGEKLCEIKDDVRLLVGVLLIVLARDLEEATVTPEEFARALNGDALADAGDAFLQSILAYSSRHQRPALTKAIAQLKAAEAKVAAIAEAVLADPRIDDEIDRKIDELRKNMELEVFGKPTT